MADAGTLLELNGVTKEYAATEDSAAVSVLRGVDLRVQHGERVAIIGPSGSGKSTLLNIIGTLDRPTAGRVTLNGRDLGTLSDAELASVRNREIGFVFQMHHLLPQCSVLENVLIPTLAQHTKTDLAETPRARAERLLQRVGLADRTTHRPGQLSGGERQRVAVVRALINGPKLLLADEPTGSLDRVSSDTLTELLGELNREEGVALVVITHAPHLAAQMGRVYELQDGLLVPKEAKTFAGS